MCGMTAPHLRGKAAPSMQHRGQQTLQSINPGAPPGKPANHVHGAANQRRLLTASKLWMLLAGTARRAEGLMPGTGAAPRIDLAARAAIRVATPGPCHCRTPPPVTARQPRLKSAACGYRYGHAISRALVSGRADAYQ